MNVYEKLMKARLELQSRDLKKSGRNNYAGYQYFELGDFLPQTMEIFASLKLAGYVNYDESVCTLTIVNCEEPTEKIYINTPMSSANLKGAHEIQNLGAVQTYTRRYLWVTAMEIVEHDALDSTLGKDAPKQKPASKPSTKPAEKLPTNQPTEKPWALSITSEENWAESVKLGAKNALAMAESKNDVLEIFKVNRTIFERLQTEAPDEYKALMALFSEHKQKFEEQ